GPPLLLEGVDRRLRHVEVGGRTERLGESVADPGSFQDLASGSAGDDTGTGSGRTNQHPGGSVLADHVVDDRRAGHGHGEHRAPSDLHALLDGGGNLFGLAVPDPNPAVAVTDDTQGGEGEATSTLHDLGDSVDLNDPLVVLVLFSHL